MKKGISSFKKFLLWSNAIIGTISFIVFAVFVGNYFLYGIESTRQSLYSIIQFIGLFLLIFYVFQSIKSLYSNNILVSMSAVYVFLSGFLILILAEIVLGIWVLIEILNKCDTQACINDNIGFGLLIAPLFVVVFLTIPLYVIALLINLIQYFRKK